jgi:hypothetical protein
LTSLPEPLECRIAPHAGSLEMVLWLTL